MDKKDKQLIAIILSILSANPQGLSINDLHLEIESRSEIVIHRRTLQRKLKQFNQDQLIVVAGKTTAILYKPAQLKESDSLQDDLQNENKTLATSQTNWEEDIPISEESSLLRSQVRQAIMYRKPVGYNRNFLTSYEPGITWYLPESLRIQLHEMGRTYQGELPPGTYVRDIFGRLLVDLSWASSRLEGNTYSRLDTQNLIEFSKIALGKDAKETQMIMNHKRAIEMMVEDINEVDFNRYTFQNLHALLSQDLMQDDAASGRLRRRPVEISGTVYLPMAMPALLDDSFQLMLEKTKAINDPFEQAFFLMVQLPYLQPFEDVNKRLSRIGANIPLIKNNLCPLSFIDVPLQAYIDGTLGVYEFNRIELLRDVFVWAYERSCQRFLAITQNMIDPDPKKIQYRHEIMLAVQKIIQEKLLPSPELINQLASQYVKKEDEVIFSNILNEAVKNIHEGSVTRFRIKLSDYLIWQPLRDANLTSH